MSTKHLRILLVTEKEQDYTTIKEYLKSVKGIEYTLHWERTYDQARTQLLKQEGDVYLIDYLFQGKTGLELLQESFLSPKIYRPVIVLTDAKVDDSDLDLIRFGASDYLEKQSLTPVLLERSIRYAVERYRTTSKLFEKEQMNANFFEQSMDPHFLLTSDMKFKDVNGALLDIFGTSRQEMNGLPVSLLFKSVLDFDIFKQRLTIDGFVRFHEITLVTKDGRDRLCVINAAELKGFDGEKTGFQGMIHDLTEQKLIEKEALLTDKYAMTGKLSRMIAHEVRNPLTNINLASLQLSKVKTDDEMFPMYLEIIDRNAKRINTLIKQLLEASLPSELNQTPIDINEVITAAVNHVEDRARLQNITLEKNLTDGLPKVNIDAQRVEIVLTNILVNGMEAITDDKGQIHIHSKPAVKKGYIKVSISDNGKGMDEKTIDGLFHPFFTQKKNGTGLGLSTARNIVKSHGGFIQVKSSLGQGSTLSILLPTH